jgi:hypothetical protein
LALVALAAIILYLKSAQTSGETEPTPEYCASLEGQYNQDWCTCTAAIIHKDPSLCEPIRSPDWKATCVKKAGHSP